MSTGSEAEITQWAAAGAGNAVGIETGLEEEGGGS